MNQQVPLARAPLSSTDFLVLIVYAGSLFFIVLHHELSHDEAQAWNIARSAKNLYELGWHGRYEGHTPLWHFVLWPLTLTGNPTLMQYLSLVISCVVALLLIRDKPFPPVICYLLLFGYFLFYEYAIIPRPYSLTVLFCALFATVSLRHKAPFWPQALLCSLLAFTSAFGLVISVPLLAYSVWRTIAEQQRFARTVLAGLCVYGVFAVLCVWFVVFPAADHSFVMEKLSGESIGEHPFSSPFVTPVIPHFDRIPFGISRFLTESTIGVALLIASVLTVICCVLLLMRGRQACAPVWLLAIVCMVLAVQISGSQSERHLGLLYIVTLTLLWASTPRTVDSAAAVSSARAASGVVRLKPLAYVVLTATLLLHVGIGLGTAMIDVRQPMSPWKQLSRDTQADLDAGHRFITRENSELIAVAAYTDTPFFDARCGCWTRYGRWTTRPDVRPEDELNTYWCVNTTDQQQLTALVSSPDWIADDRHEVVAEYRRGVREPAAYKPVIRLYRLTDAESARCEGIDSIGSVTVR